MSEQNAPDSKVIERIRKLLALSQNNTNENEAAAAAAKVQDMLAEHNLSMAALDDSGQQSEGRKKSTLVGKAMYQWQRDLMAAVAESNFCYHDIIRMYRKGVKNKKGVEALVPSHLLIGRESNVTSALVMFEYLLEVIAKAVPVADASQRLSNSAVSWREGCAYRLGERLRAKRADMERASREREAAARHPASGATPGTGLVLADVFSREEDLNHDFRHGYAPGTTAAKRAERAARAAAGPDVVYSDAWWALQDEKSRAIEAARRAALTPAQRAREDEKAAREAQRYHERSQRQNDVYWAKRDIRAFNAGMRKGSEINLDQQIDREKRKKIS